MLSFSDFTKKSSLAVLAAAVLTGGVGGLVVRSFAGAVDEDVASISPQSRSLVPVDVTALTGTARALTAGGRWLDLTAPMRLAGLAALSLDDSKSTLGVDTMGHHLRLSERARIWLPEGRRASELLIERGSIQVNGQALARAKVAGRPITVSGRSFTLRLVEARVEVSAEDEAVELQVADETRTVSGGEKITIEGDQLKAAEVAEAPVLAEPAAEAPEVDEPKVAPKPEPVLEAKPKVEPKAKPEPKVEPNAKPEPKVEPKAKPEPEPKPDPATELADEPKDEVEDEPKAESPEPEKAPAEPSEEKPKPEEDEIELEWD